MPTKNASETIEILSRKLERVRILNDLKACTGFEDVKEYIDNLEALVERDRQSEC